MSFGGNQQVVLLEAPHPGPGILYLVCSSIVHQFLRPALVQRTLSPNELRVRPNIQLQQRVTANRNITTNNRNSSAIISAFKKQQSTTTTRTTKTTTTTTTPRPFTGKPGTIRENIARAFSCYEFLYTDYIFWHKNLTPKNLTKISDTNILAIFLNIYSLKNWSNYKLYFLTAIMHQPRGNYLDNLLTLYNCIHIKVTLIHLRLSVWYRSSNGLFWWSNWQDKTSIFKNGNWTNQCIDFGWVCFPGELYGFKSNGTKANRNF